MQEMTSIETLSCSVRPYNTAGPVLDTAGLRQVKPQQQRAESSRGKWDGISIDRTGGGQFFGWQFAPPWRRKG